jgi:hypothetical protein
MANARKASMDRLERSRRPPDLRGLGDTQKSDPMNPPPNSPTRYAIVGLGGH